MYSDNDIEAAVYAGSLSREAADALRTHAARERGGPLADSEQVHYISGYDEIFVVAAGIIALIGAGFTFGLVWPPLGGLAVAGMAWGIIEIFVRGRQMALPGIVFYGMLNLGLLIFSAALLIDFRNIWSLATMMAPTMILWSQVLASVLVAVAGWLVWLRFRLPIAFAGAIAGIAGIPVSLATAVLFPGAQQLTLLIMFICGLAVFVYAMRWDMLDITRTGPASTMGFWLHLTAAPLVVTPLFFWLGMNLNASLMGTNAGFLALIAVVFYIAICVVALIIDRRALALSGMIYVTIALSYLTGTAGGPLNALPSAATGAMLAGVGLLIFAGAWTALRRAVLRLVPAGWLGRLPAA